MITNKYLFFDTESLLLAQKLGYRVTEIPVHWVETRDEWLDARPSKVKVLTTIREYLRSSFRLRVRLFFLKNSKKTR